MKPARILAATLTSIFICAPVAASDPNRVCAESADQLQQTMMDESQLARNILSKYSYFIKEPFSKVVSDVRKIGADQYLQNSVLALDDSKLCDQAPPRCYSRQEMIELLKPALDGISALPDLYDHYLIFQDIRAIDYAPILDRTTCHLDYFFDLSFLRKWFSNQGASAADIDKSLEFTTRTTNTLRAIGKNFERTFTIQPNGRGGNKLMLLSN